MQLFPVTHFFLLKNKVVLSLVYNLYLLYKSEKQVSGSLTTS